MAVFLLIAKKLDESTHICEIRSWFSIHIVCLLKLYHFGLEIWIVHKFNLISKRLAKTFYLSNVLFIINIKMVQKRMEPKEIPEKRRFFIVFCSDLRIYLWSLDLKCLLIHLQAFCSSWCVAWSKNNQKWLFFIHSIVIYNLSPLTHA